jgi:hypothetical protein
MDMMHVSHIGAFYRKEARHSRTDYQYSTASVRAYHYEHMSDETPTDYFHNMGRRSAIGIVSHREVTDAMLWTAEQITNR